MKEKTCCFTGHRNIPKEEYPRVSRLLRKEIKKLIRQGILYFGAGGALGFDTLAALAVLELKEANPHIKLILVLPCPEQSHRWNQADAALYEHIKEKSDKVVYTSSHYTQDCMFKRNRHLIDNSSVCLCYLTQAEGGTAYTVNYARSQGLKIINIAPHR